LGSSLDCTLAVRIGTWLFVLVLRSVTHQCRGRTFKLPVLLPIVSSLNHLPRPTERNRNLLFDRKNGSHSTSISRASNMKDLLSRGEPLQRLRFAPRQCNDSRLCLTFCHTSPCPNPTCCNRFGYELRSKLSYRQRHRTLPPTMAESNDPRLTPVEHRPRFAGSTDDTCSLKISRLLGEPWNSQARK
jgi:hypothetical protein